MFNDPIKLFTSINRLIKRVIAFEPRHLALLGNPIGPASYSARIHSIVERYMVVVGDAVPDLGYQQWQQIIRLCADAEPATADIVRLPDFIQSAASSIEPEADINSEGLIESLQDMTVEEKCAVAEFLDRYYSWGGSADAPLGSIDRIQCVLDSFRETSVQADSQLSNEASPVSRY